MAVFDWAESRSSSVDVAPRVQETRFGDGYVQAVPDGINTMQEQWDLVFDQVDDAIATQIDDFLRARGGWETFDWTPIWAVGNSPIKVVCKQWRRQKFDIGVSTITATFERRYTP